ncbi:amino acid adenylation domain-containing protein [Paenibacillus pabuli]|uniref:LLM class flavin-dependent oxidoreductase n=1 Tax=Paenibacillus pabuli TaxID=1472 RepID=UPI003CEA5F91
MIQKNDVEKALFASRFVKEEKYWLDQLSGEWTKTSFPYDSLEYEKGNARDNQFFAISNSTFETIYSICNRSDSQLYMFLAASLFTLLHYYTEKDDIVIGTPVYVPNVGEHVLLGNSSILLRNRISESATFKQLLIGYKNCIQEAIEHQNLPVEVLADKLGLASISDLFDCALAMNRLHTAGAIESNPASIIFSFSTETGQLEGRINFDMSKYRDVTIARIANHFQHVLELVSTNLDIRLSDIELLSEWETLQILDTFNKTEHEFPYHKTISQFIDEQALRSPSHIALRFGEEYLTFRQLKNKSDQVALYLRESGVKPNEIVALFMNRSIHMVVGLLAILKSGGAYLPIDPEFPEDRVHYMLADSRAKMVLTLRHHEPNLSAGIKSLYLDEFHYTTEPVSEAEPGYTAGSDDLAYVMYTSGSTGKPKGVMVSHRNLCNFFTGMDEVIRPDSKDCLLAVTTVSFDISVLELIWTLARGIQVVLKAEDMLQTGNYNRFLKERTLKKLDFSVFFFSSYNTDEIQGKYNTLVGLAQYADSNGYSAVWTPERHFHEFGGLFPNPSVLSSALAMVTEQIQIRAGSVVSPIHDPIRIVEEWSVVDNLSNGRIGLSFASGWHADDFVLAPGHYQNRVNKMYEQLEQVRSLWRGEAVVFENGTGNDVPVQTYPKPIQKELGIWITSAGSKETFAEAGRRGVNILTHLLGQDIVQLEENIRLYRDTLKQNGFSEDVGKVTLMLHTYIGENLDEVKKTVKGPLCDYIRSSVGLLKNLAQSLSLQENYDQLEEELLEYAFERYWNSSALIGTPETCSKLIEQLRQIDVNEISCLLDFGLTKEQMMTSLQYVTDLKRQFEFTNPDSEELRPITMMQTTPSRLKTLLEDESSLAYLQSLRTILVGGEKLPPGIAASIKKITDARLINFYGPTETTVWSTAYEVQEESPILVGKPIANTRIYILSKQQKLLPIGAVGELYIGGEGVTQGYWNKGDLTREKFIHDPYSRQPHALMYRTGDLARYHSDGNIELIGRADDQLKIRGYRVEPGEIENAALRHPAVNNVIVLYKQDVDEHRYLIGYFVAKDPLSPLELKKYLEDCLPHYMVPSVFIKVDAIPLTPNGKTDRKALLLMKIPSESSYEEATTLTESNIAEIWGEILDLQNIGVTSNFFNLGGSSLMAMMLAFRLQKNYKITLNLKDIFDKPTVREQAQFVESASELQPIPPAALSEYYPVISMQNRIYIVSEMKGKHIGYNMSRMFTLHGKIDYGRIKHVFEQIVQRHEIFRTRFGVVNSETVQIIDNDAQFEMEFDKCSFDDLQIQAREFVRPFELKNDQLFRVKLLFIDDDTHALFIDMHHIISDGPWTVGLLMKEFASLYNGNTLQQAAIQFKDYAVWHQEKLRKGHFAHQEEYWISMLQEAPLLDLPTDFPRPPVHSFEGARVGFSMDDQLSDAVKKFAHTNKYTLFTVLLTAYYCLLSKYSGQDDIIVGTPVAGRTHPDLDMTMGLFINTLAIRNYPSANKSFLELLGEVNGNVVQAFEYIDYPFEEILKRVQVRRDMSRNPLFDTMFILQNPDDEIETIHGVEVRPYEFVPPISKVDLTLEASEVNGRINISLEYSSNLFHERTIERLGRHYLALIQSAINNPDAALGELVMLSDFEKTQLQVQFNNTEMEYDETALIHELFEQQATAQPHRTAVKYGNDEMSYGELNDLANRLAYKLQDLGVEKDTRVGILLPRSLELFIAILAVLKAGGAYIPLDPEFPRERLEYMLSDSGARILLTKKDEPDLFNGTVLTLSKKMIEEIGEKTHQSNSRGHSNNLAYIIYTSGSTGRPKGVMIEHRNVVNFINGMSRVLDVRSDQTILSLTTVSFDIFVVESLLPLSLGMGVLLASEDEAKNPDMLGKLLDLHPVEWVQLTPSRMRALLSSKRMHPHLASIQNIIVGGEAFPVYLYQQMRTITNAQIFNMYGPTETTVWSMSKKIDRFEEITIGSPIANTRVYILDSSNALAGIGIPGELCIAGDGVARGYLNNAELTRSKFIPYSAVKDERVYRTGDLARWLPSGEIQFLGRLDHQVKIRGYRIELAEVEEALENIAEINRAIVVANQMEDGQAQLIGFYVLGVENVSQEFIRGALSRRLPEYMIPSYLIAVDKFPTTLNGKINRNALLDQFADYEPDKTESTAVPLNEMEHSLAQMWKSVAGHAAIGRHDKFLDSGGNSLTLILFLEKINVMYPGILTIADLFGYSTISALSTHISAVSGSDIALTIHDEPLGLPEGFFTVDGETKLGNILQYELSVKATLAIRQIAATYEVAEFDVMAALFVYILAEMLDANEIPLLVQDGENMCLMRIQFEQVEHFREIFSQVYACRKAGEMINVRLKKRHSLQRLERKAYILFSNNAREEMAGEYDLLLRTWTSSDRIYVSCDIDGSRLDIHSVSTLIESYIGLLYKAPKIIPEG